jgi:predicted DCC family thiol-disulfide oxidoreductase YuxK
MILAYDAGCGPCTNFKSIISFLSPRKKIGFVSLVAADESGLLDSLDSEKRYRSFHLLVPGQNISSGAEALPVLFGLIMGGRLVERAIQSIPFGFQTVSSVYGVLSRLHDSGSCNALRLGTSGNKRVFALGLRPKLN